MVMLSLLRRVTIIAAALIVFGWGVSAGQTQQQPTPSNLPNVRLQAMPDVDANFSHSAYQRTPNLSKPDFGDVPSVAWLRPSTTRIASRPSYSHSDQIEWQSISATSLESSYSPFAEHTVWLADRPAPPAKAIVQADHRFSSHQVTIERTSVNLGLLRKRITNHNLTLDTVADQLQQQEHWQLAQIESVVAQLQLLIEDQQLWLMYWNLLSPERRRIAGAVSPTKPVLELLRQRIFETRVSADIDVQAVSALNLTDTKLRLTSLNQKVTAWIKTVSEH